MKHLLPKVSKYFKTNLHTHSNISDGKLGPEEVVDRYKKAGYQILSLTDHNTIADHSQFSQPDFLMLTGVEIHINAPGKDAIAGQTFHLNMIAKEPGNLWSPSRVDPRFPQAAVYTEKMQFEEMDLHCDPESINAMIAKANEKGFLVMYNHPTWSCQSYPDYAPLKGLWAIEMRNSECCVLGNNENNARVWKDLLNLGNKVYPVGADDMHSPRALGQSWIMVGVEKLEYASVINALEHGDFYMSCGPKINSLTIDGNILRITCSDARSISIESYGRWARRLVAENDAWLHEAEFDLTPILEKAADSESFYIHLTVTAPDGTYAATRAYYLNELA